MCQEGTSRPCILANERNVNRLLDELVVVRELTLSREGPEYCADLNPAAWKARTTMSFTPVYICRQCRE